MNGPAVSACTSSELEQVVDLVNAAYRGVGGSAGWTSEIDMVHGQRITTGFLRQDLAVSPHATVLVMREADHLLACVRLERTGQVQGELACYLGMLAVRPGLQDRGLGRVMLEHAEEQGRAWGAKVMRMTVVSVRGSLIAWYERCGYCRTGQTEPFPYEDARFGTPLRSDLQFVVLEKHLDAVPGN